MSLHLYFKIGNIGRNYKRQSIEKLDRIVDVPLQSKRKEIGNECLPIDSTGIEPRSREKCDSSSYLYCRCYAAFITPWWMRRGMKGCSLFPHFFSRLSFFPVYVLFPHATTQFITREKAFNENLIELSR